MKCFPSTASVNLEDGKSALMSELKVGDRVQTGVVENFKTYFLVQPFFKRFNQTMGGSRVSQKGASTYFLLNISRKLHENE